MVDESICLKGRSVYFVKGKANGKFRKAATSSTLNVTYTVNSSNEKQNLKKIQYLPSTGTFSEAWNDGKQHTMSTAKMQAETDVFVEICKINSTPFHDNEA